ncbi:hypothetical protein GCM10018789_01240 [Streptomyces werraensis]|nr:hypothetical protein GCM10018789_01240 [Streptomyces werraensis]
MTVDQLALLFALLLGAVVSVPVGERLRLPAPVLMTVFGIVLALLNFVPNVDVPPQLILPLLLPPLLYAAVRRTSWRQFAANVRPILLLAVALVFVTTFCVAAVAHAIVPGLPLAAAVALGALVAPPDPVAATAVAGKLGLPRRLVSILEGEGLFNDVTAIVLYHVAVAAAVSGTFSPWAAGLDLVLSAVVAVAVGLVLGWATNKAMDLLGDPTLQVALTLLVPPVRGRRTPLHRSRPARLRRGGRRGHLAGGARLPRLAGGDRRLIRLIRLVRRLRVPCAAGDQTGAAARSILCVPLRVR